MFAIVNILDALEEVGEERVKEKLGRFSCSRNAEIDFFVNHRAIDFAKKHISITYLVLNEANDIAAYFTLAHKPIFISLGNMSKTLQRKVSRFASFSSSDSNFHASAFLLAQLGKNTNVAKHTMISGKDLIDMAIEILADIRHRIGGGIIFLECEDIQKIIDFYEKNNFKIYSRRTASDGIEYNQMLYVM